MNILLKSRDPEMFNLIRHEFKRQRRNIELIASENFTSSSVRECLGSILTNKYSEGLPNRRYYGGNEYIDEIELLCQKRALNAYRLSPEDWHVNVQPYSGSPANQAVFFALLNLHDKFLGFSLTSGGHLTHGSHVNFSGKNYVCVSYDVDKETEMLDMDNIRKLAKEEKPKMIISGLTAYPREIDFKAFQEIAEEVDAYQLADISHISGLVVGGAHPSPIPYADVVTTTTHKSLRGPRGAIIMSKMEDRLHELYHSDKKVRKTGEPRTLASVIDSAVFPGLQGGPHDHTTAAKAVAFAEALKPEFKDYAKQIVENVISEWFLSGVKPVDPFSSENAK